MSEEKKQHAVDKEAFAVVNDQPQTAEKEKKSKKGLIIALAAIAVVVLALAVWRFAASGGNAEAEFRTSSGVGIMENSHLLYHVSPDGKAFMETDITGKMQSTLLESPVGYITNYQHRYYYYDLTSGTFCRYNDGGEDTALFRAAVAYPTYRNGYVYFIDAGASAGGYLCRHKLTENAETEVVLPIAITEYTLSGSDIVYYDPTINALVILPEKTALALPDGEAQTSASAGARVIVSDTYTTNLLSKGNTVYYLDGGDSKTYTVGQNQKLTGNKLCAADKTTGKVTEISHGIYVTEIAASKEYLFYVQASNGHVCRCGDDGGDIRDITGTEFAYPYALCVNGGYVTFRATDVYYDDSMQTQYEALIGVCKVSGEKVCRVRAAGGAKENAPAVDMPEVEIPDEDAMPKKDEAQDTAPEVTFPESATMAE